MFQVFGRLIDCDALGLIIWRKVESFKTDVKKRRKKLVYPILKIYIILIYTCIQMFNLLSLLVFNIFQL